MGRREQAQNSRLPLAERGHGILRLQLVAARHENQRQDHPRQAPRSSSHPGGAGRSRRRGVLRPPARLQGAAAAPGGKVLRRPSDPRELKDQAALLSRRCRLRHRATRSHPILGIPYLCNSSDCEK